MKRSGLSTQKLYKAIRVTPCICCGTLSEPRDVAHIKSKGAGGPNTDWNCIPLCRRDHRLQHDQGWYVFLGIHIHLWEKLKAMGWEWIGTKLWNEKLKK